MNSDSQRPRSLREIEMAVEAEGREWTRQRLEQELQKEADLQGINRVVVNEAGASVYSADPIAREEFPDLDPTIRSAARKMKRRRCLAEHA